MTDVPAQTGDLRDRVAKALTEWTLTVAGGRPDAFLLPRDRAALDANSLARADAVLAVVSSFLEERDTENARLRKDLSIRDVQVRKLRFTVRRLRAAWASARIGRAHARAAAQAWWDSCLVIGDERDQAKAELGERTTTVAQLRRAVRDAAEERDQALVGEETAKGWRDAAIVERDKLRETVRAYEDGITWLTSCTGCAGLMNKLYDADMRCEQAEDLFSRRIADRDAEIGEARDQIIALAGERDRFKDTLTRIRAVRDRWYQLPMMSDYADELDAALDKPEEGS
jgi:hypothetical protein